MVVPAAHPGHALEVVGWDGFLEPQWVVDLQPAGQPQGSRRGELAVGAEQKISPVTDSFPDGPGIALRQVKTFKGRLATVKHGVGAGRVELDGCETHFDGPECHLGGHVRVGVEVRSIGFPGDWAVGIAILRVQVGIGAQALVDPAS